LKGLNKREGREGEKEGEGEYTKWIRPHFSLTTAEDFELDEGMSSRRRFRESKKKKKFRAMQKRDGEKRHFYGLRDSSKNCHFFQHHDFMLLKLWRVSLQYWQYALRFLTQLEGKKIKIW
jgi:hypothetical protein